MCRARRSSDLHRLILLGIRAASTADMPKTLCRLDERIGDYALVENFWPMLAQVFQYFQ